MTRVALLLGGNQGDVKRTLQTAQQLINSRVGAVLRCSHRYESAPWGFRPRSVFRIGFGGLDRPFRRSKCSTPVSRSSGSWAATVLPRRSRKPRSGAAYSSRPIDIDIIFYGDEVIDDERLTVPHPLLAEREFALQPLAEIMRRHRHPVTGVTVGEMLGALHK